MSFCVARKSLRNAPVQNAWLYISFISYSTKKFWQSCSGTHFNRFIFVNFVISLIPDDFIWALYILHGGQQRRASPLSSLGCLDWWGGTPSWKIPGSIILVCGLLVSKTFSAITLSLTIKYFEMVQHLPEAFKGLLHQNESWDILLAVLRQV